MAAEELEVLTRVGDDEMTERQTVFYVYRARFSADAIDAVIAKIADGVAPSYEDKGVVRRNVTYLKQVVRRPEVLDFGIDVTDLHSAIARGEENLESDVWDGVLPDNSHLGILKELGLI